VRLINFRVSGLVRAGRVFGESVEDLSVAFADWAVRVGRPPSVDDLLADHMLWRRVLDAADEPLQRDLIPLAQVELLPPVLHPSKILVVGANTWSHLREGEVYTGAIAPKRPMVLSKPPSALNSPNGDIEFPPMSTQLDYEVEIAAIIGSRARNVSVKEALAHVAGLTVANDVSARDVQLSSWEDNDFFRTHYLGKGFDGFCPLGPALVTLDELGDIGGLRLRSLVNGSVRQSSSATDLVFDIAGLVSYISSVMTLEPGDVILTGSPEGVGYFHPEGMLSVGDVVTCEVDGIGAITNRIVAPSVSAVHPLPVASPAPLR